MMITIIKNLGLAFVTLVMLLALYFLFILTLYIILSSIIAIIDEIKDFRKGSK